MASLLNDSEISLVYLTPQQRAVQHIHHRYNGPSDGRYSVCTIGAILDSCFTELVFCGLSCFPFGCIIFNTLNTMEENGNG